MALTALSHSQGSSSGVFPKLILVQGNEQKDIVLNRTPFSVGRHLRNTMSACLMVANERIHQTNASLLLIAKEV